MHTHTHICTHIHVRAHTHTHTHTHRDLRENIVVTEAVNMQSNDLLRRDDYTLLKDVKLTLDRIEGIFTNPPPVAPR